MRAYETDICVDIDYVMSQTIRGRLSVVSRFPGRRHTWSESMESSCGSSAGIAPGARCNSLCFALYLYAIALEWRQIVRYRIGDILNV